MRRVLQGPTIRHWWPRAAALVIGSTALLVRAITRTG